LLKVGNPYLRPQLTHAWELGVGRSWSGGSAGVAGYRRDITDAFKRVYAIDDSNPDYDIVNKVYQNVGHSTQMGVEITAEQQVIDAWRISGALNWFVNDVDALETTLHFPTTRPFTLAASRDDTWDLSVNSRFRLPHSAVLQLGYVYYAGRNAPQGRERERSSLDLAATLPIRNDRAEVAFTFTDVLSDFAIRRDIDGVGFTARYENYLETQVATVGVKVRF
jgi:hypothetical protein